MRTPTSARPSSSAPPGRPPRRPGPPRPRRAPRVLAGALLVTALALTGCGAGSGSSQGDGKAAAEGGAADTRRAGPGASGAGTAARAATGAPAPSATAVVRTASLTVRVEDVPRALDDARSAAEGAGGYVGDETTTRDDEGRERTRVVLRVPAERYARVLADLEGAGRVLERRAEARDVTDQVVDVRSRIASQRASVTRVRALMDKAAKLGDVVTLEGELSRREADLEALLAREAALKDRTSMATITLSLSRTAAPAPQEGDGPGFADALSGGWRVLVTLVRWLALAIGAVLPFAAVAVPIAAVWRFVVRSRLRPRSAAGPVPAPSAPAPPAAGDRAGDGADRS
ncbi:DUF4349 domain-containing protein [Streptomyces sp. NPDC048566]|uniref:DUF4349 domain-containing protein n=1 Tax=Streptomyces sp. NPDC048566 TaxID=3365569 RepID=UPI003721B15B